MWRYVSASARRQIPLAIRDGQGVCQGDWLVPYPNSLAAPTDKSLAHLSARCCIESCPYTRRPSRRAEPGYSTTKLYVSLSSTNVWASDGEAPGYTTLNGGFACIVIVAWPGWSVAKLNR